MSDIEELKGAQSQVEELSQRGSDSYDFTPAEVAAYQLDPKLSARICRKYDVRVLPLVWCMYFFSALDRTNLGNAKTDGFEEALGLHGNQYNTILAVQSACFAFFTLFGAFAVRYWGPRRALPPMMLGWGTMAMAAAAAKSFGSAIAVRFLLGGFEGLFGPTLVIYMAAFYRREEMAKRVAIYYSSSTIAGAFSGLLSYAVFTATAWPGGMTVLMAFLAILVLPDYPQQARFLNEEEKVAAVMRLLKGTSKAVNPAFNKREYFEPLRHWRFYAFALLGITYGTAQSSAQTFLPQIIGRFGYSVVRTNLLTVGPYLVGTVWLLFNAWLSDRLQQRAWILIGALLTTMTGCIILAATDLGAIAAGYFACFLIEMGAFIPTSVFHTWHNNNDSSENGRAFRTGALTFAANTGSVISSQIFLNSDAPKYEHALIASFSLPIFGVVVALILRYSMVIENRRRDRAQGVTLRSKDVAAIDEGREGSSTFRYVL